MLRDDRLVAVFGDVHTASLLLPKTQRTYTLQIVDYVAPDVKTPPRDERAGIELFIERVRAAYRQPRNPRLRFNIRTKF